MRTFTSAAELQDAVGEELGSSAWLTVSQDVIDAFADATGDHQFIHVDPEKAKQTPFGGTIAHGLYTLSLGPKLLEEIWGFENVAMAVNYGYDKVRFPAPVPVDSKLRMTATLTGADEVGGGGVQAKVTQSYEIEGGSKPVCVAEALMRLYFQG